MGLVWGAVSNIRKVEKLPVSCTVFVFLVQRIKRVTSDPMSVLGHCENSGKNAIEKNEIQKEMRIKTLLSEREDNV